jgi:hypothetical protein
MARHRADRQRIGFKRDTRQLRQRVQIDQMRRLREAHIHHRREALSSGDHLGVKAVKSKKRQRVVKRTRPMIRKCSGFHTPSFGREAAAVSATSSQ